MTNDQRVKNLCVFISAQLKAECKLHTDRHGLWAAAYRTQKSERAHFKTMHQTVGSSLLHADTCDHELQQAPIATEELTTNRDAVRWAVGTCDSAPRNAIWKITQLKTAIASTLFYYHSFVLESKFLRQPSRSETTTPLNNERLSSCEQLTSAAYFDRRTNVTPASAEGSLQKLQIEFLRCNIIVVTFGVRSFEVGSVRRLLTELED